MRRDWRYVEKNSHYYYQVHDGKVIGQAYNIAFTIVWGAKIPVNATDELILGQYIELEYAKKAIEEYWDEKDRTIEGNNEYLLPGYGS
jgi:hypothetical protein